MAKGAFKSLRHVLSGAEAADWDDEPGEDTNLPYLPSRNARLYGASDEALPALQATLSDTVFFTVVDSALSRAVRTKVLVKLS